MSELRLDVGTANELKLGMRTARASDGSEWTDADVKNLTSSDFLGKVLSVLRGQAEIVMKKVEATVVSILTLIKTVRTSAVAGKKTHNCFTNKSRYYYRDSDLDNWLPADQPEQAESKFSVQQLTQNSTFAQAAREFIGAPNTATIAELAHVLREVGAVTTLPTIESLIERQEKGEDVGLRTNRYANFFFVEEKEEEGKEPCVSVVRAYRGGRRWCVGVGRLGGDSLWYDGYRFFLCNKTL